MDLTAEQQQAIVLAKTGDDLKIEAFAGSGKTTTLKEIGKVLSNKRGLYVAFNKAIAEEAGRTFPRNVTCKTMASLAHKFEAKPYINKGDVKWDFGGHKLTPNNIAFILGISDKLFGVYANQFCELIVLTINKFCNSADPKINLHNVPIKYLRDIEKSKGITLGIDMIRYEVMKSATMIWDKQVDLECLDIPANMSTILKLWQLNIGNPKKQLKYDFILFDEAQDANPVMLDIVMKSQGQKIYVGDRYQQIYSWRGAVNAMDEIKTKNFCQITQSFRFGQSIADVANRILNEHLGADVSIKGFNKLNSKVTMIDEPDCIICRTNICLINEALKLIDRRKKVAINGGVKDLIALLKGAQDLQNDISTKQPDLAGFKNWNDVKEYSKTELGGDLKVLVSLVEKYEIKELIKSLYKVQKNTKPDIFLTTAHKSKGCEWGTVQLANDFRRPNGNNYTKEESNLLYVAITRAQNVLDIEDCKACEPMDSVDKKIIEEHHKVVVAEPNLGKGKKKKVGRKLKLPSDYLENAVDLEEKVFFEGYFTKNIAEKHNITVIDEWATDNQEKWKKVQSALRQAKVRRSSSDKKIMISSDLLKRIAKQAKREGVTMKSIIEKTLDKLIP